MTSEPAAYQVPPPKDWQDFERHLCELLTAHWGCRAEPNGRTGQPQHGVDIYGQPDGGETYHGVQCKLHDGQLNAAVTEAELTAEIDKATKFKPRIAHFILATTGPRDAKIQAVVRRLNQRKRKPFTVEVMFWDDILTVYGQHREVFERHYPFVAPGLHPLHQLPAAPADFTGRAEELDRLTREIRSASPAAAAGAVLTGINGMGGVGKTALALKLAHDLAGEYPGAQLFLDLRGVADVRVGLGPVRPEEALQHVLRAFMGLDAKLPDDLPTLQAGFRSLLSDLVAKGKPALILWDNARDAEQVRPLTPPPRCLMLVTSRRAFFLEGMIAQPVGQLPPADARGLLRAIAARANRTLTDAQADRLAELCGRLPQALRLAGGALASRRDISPDDLAQRLTDLDRRLQALDAYKDDSGERSLRTSMEMTEALLPEEVRTKWHLLAVFPGDFDPLAAAAVWGNVTAGTTVEEGAKSVRAARSTLSDLAVFNALEFDERKGRYRLHDLVRSFLLDRLSHATPPNDEADAVRRFVEHYANFAAMADDILEQKDGYVRGLALFDAEWANTQAAFEVASAQGGKHAWADGALVRLAGGCPYCLDLRVHGLAKVHWLTVGLEAARRAKNRQAEGNALGNLGLAYAALGDARKAIESHTQALAVSREIGDRRGEGQDLGNLGIAYAKLGETRKAIEFYEQALAASREIGDRRGEGAVLGNLGLAYAALGDARKAIEFYEQQLGIAREIGDRRGEGAALGNLGNAHKNLGDARKAIESHTQALAVSREIGDRRGEGQDLGNLGLAYAAVGDARKAIDFHTQALAVSREIADRRDESYTSWNIGRLFVQQGRHAEGTKLMQVLVDYFTEIGHSEAAERRAEVERIRAGGKL
jgi:tetratricopeptide (TPR) repeat protein